MHRVSVFYEDYCVGKIYTNRSLSVDEALEILRFDENDFLEKTGFDDIDYNVFEFIWID